MAKVCKSDGQGTFAGTQGNGEVAPIPAVRRSQRRRRLVSAMVRACGQDQIRDVAFGWTVELQPINSATTRAATLTSVERAVGLRRGGSPFAQPREHSPLARRRFDDDCARHARADQYTLRQETKGLPAKLDIGDPLPAEIEVLPKPEVFMEDRCSVAAFPEGEEVEPEETEAVAA